MEVNTYNIYSFVLHTVCMYTYTSVCTNVQVEPTDTEC